MLNVWDMPLITTDTDISGISRLCLYLIEDNKCFWVFFNSRLATVQFTCLTSRL